MYETLIHIDQNTAITEDLIQTALNKAYPDTSGSNPTVIQRDSDFKVKWPNFGIEIHLSDLPHVLEESREIAERFAKGRTEQERISQCFTRVEITGDEDPGMEYFNDYCYIISAIENIGIVYTFDQGSLQFMNI